MYDCQVIAFDLYGAKVVDYRDASIHTVQFISSYSAVLGDCIIARDMTDERSVSGKSAYFCLRQLFGSVNMNNYRHDGSLVMRANPEEFAGYAENPLVVARGVQGGTLFEARFLYPRPDRFVFIPRSKILDSGGRAWDLSDPHWWGYYRGVACMIVTLMRGNSSVINLDFRPDLAVADNNDVFRYYDFRSVVKW